MKRSPEAARHLKPPLLGPSVHTFVQFIQLVAHVRVPAHLCKMSSSLPHGRQRNILHLISNQWGEESQHTCT